MTTTYELYTNENGTPKAVEGKAPAIIERVEALETDVTGLDTALAGKAPMSHTHTIANVTGLQVDLTAIHESITNVSSKVDGIGDTLSPTYAKKQAILDACDKATNPVHEGDPTLGMDDQTFLNKLAEKLSKLGTIRPLGFHYLHPYGTVPADSIICNGATYSRALYKDFFDYITTQGWVKTEAEWQGIAMRDNGFCPFYSSGDGITNFRTPKFAPYQQVAMGVAQATTYHQAGLPNNDGTPWVSEASGCFEYLSSKKIVPDGMENATYGVRFDASRSSSVYGRSITASHKWVMCVVAYGIATNVGSVDMQNVMSAVNAVQASIALIPQPRTYVTQTWNIGTEWYRVWSDGFIEQGGHGIGNACTFSKPFAYINYTFNVQPSNGYLDHPDWIAVYEHRPQRTVIGTGLALYSGGEQGWDWCASGY